jgi:hypothetical protein
VLVCWLRAAFFTLPYFLLATLASSPAERLLEQLRRGRLPAPVWTWSMSQADGTAWPGSPAAPAPGAATPDDASAPGAALNPGPGCPDELPGPVHFVYDYLPRPFGASPVHPSEVLMSSPTGHVQLLRLLFQLVLVPELAASPLASLAAHTQLPATAVRQVLASLAKQGFWHEAAPPGTSPLRLPAPAHYWLAHYAGILRRRLNAQRYRLRHPAPLASWAQLDLPTGCLWSGEAAAHRLLGHPAPPGSLTIHSHLPRPQLTQLLGLVPASKGPIELLNAFAPASFSAPTDPHCVPPLLVYADLLASPSPTAAALAATVRAHYLAELLAYPG